MENFRPPAMDEVKQQQSKMKYILISVIVFSVIVLGIGGYWGIKQLTIYLNYLSVEKKHQLLSNYYKALASKDQDILTSIAPNFLSSYTYNFEKSNGSYSLYIYPVYYTNDNYLLVHLIDNSTSPSTSYLQEIIYSKLTNNIITIENISILGEGRQID